jgi:hypothetical protein
MGGTMKLIRVVVAVVILVASAVPSWAIENAGLDTELIEKETGLKGTMQEGGVFQVTYPRKDLHPVVAGVHMTPPMGLTAWSSFQKAGDHTMVMGDIVLTEDQVAPVMDAALNNGLEVTALHNHFFWDSPKIMFMHIGGMGEESKLAAGVGKVFAKLKETSTKKESIEIVDIDPAKSTLDTAKIDSAIGSKGKLTDGVYKVTIGRKTTMGGVDVGKTMGVNTWAAFAGTDSKAVVDGDFAMLESEVQAVLKALRHAGINIVAIHNHMTNEAPRIIFLHYWGVGPVEELAKSLKSALDTEQTK